MDEVELLREIVSTLVRGLTVPVTCKIRIYKGPDGYARTLRLCEALVDSGASLLTVHGRTREEKKQAIQDADWDVIRRLKLHFAKRLIPVPVVANGGIETLTDVYRCIALTGVDGVMSSEAILENPALFSDYFSRSLNRTVTQLELAGTAV